MVAETGHIRIGGHRVSRSGLLEVALMMAIMRALADGGVFIYPGLTHPVPRTNKSFTGIDVSVESIHTWCVPIKS